MIRPSQVMDVVREFCVNQLCTVMHSTAIKGIGCTGVAEATDGRERPMCTDAPVSRRPRMAESDATHQITLIKRL